MSKKKSYMDNSNILNEGFLTNFFKFLTKGKQNDVGKTLNKHRSFRSRVRKFEKEHDDFMRWLQKNIPEKDPLGKGWKR